MMNMMNIMKKCLVRRLFILLLAGILLFTSSASAAGTLIGTKLKNIKVQTTTGETFDLYSTLEEKDAILIDLWFIECDFCWQCFYYLQEAMNQYGDRIAVLALDIQGGDKLEEIAALTENRSVENIIFAKDAGVRGIVRANMFPHTLLVGKGGYILADDLSMSDQLASAMGYAAGMTEQDYADIEEWAKKDRKSAEEYFTLVTYQPDHKDRPLEEKNRAWVNRMEREIPYTSESKMSFSVSGENMREIIVEENLNVLKSWKHLGRFYIAPEHTFFTVDVEVGKGVNIKKAQTRSLSDFSSAAKSGNVYTLSGMVRDLNEYFLYPGDKNSYRDGEAGFICFTSEESAAWFFRQMSMDCGYAFPWHIADQLSP